MTDQDISLALIHQLFKDGDSEFQNDELFDYLMDEFPIMHYERPIEPLYLGTVTQCYTLKGMDLIEFLHMVVNEIVTDLKKLWSVDYAYIMLQEKSYINTLAMYGACRFLTEDNIQVMADRYLLEFKKMSAVDFLTEAYLTMEGPLKDVATTIMKFPQVKEEMEDSKKDAIDRLNEMLTEPRRILQSLSLDLHITPKT